MKSSNLLRISVLPLIIVTALAVSNIEPQQGKGNSEKAQGGSGGKGNAQGGQQKSPGQSEGHGNSKGQGNSNQGHGNSSVQGGQGRGNDSRGQGRSGADKGQGHNESPGAKNGNQGRGNGKNGDVHDMDKPGNQGRGHAQGTNEYSGRGKMYRGNGNSVTMNGKRDTEIDWGFDDFDNRRRPGQKKVTICHHAGGAYAEYPVTISVSENAVQAHLNHGDQVGDCTVDYGNRWSADYLESRQDVYNNYEQAWETMSFSEALLNYAVQRLLGVRTDLTRNRVNYTSQEIQRREALIYELQNNVNALENQLGYTRQRLDSDVNIIIQL